jgi:hypothetical protein
MVSGHHIVKLRYRLFLAPQKVLLDIAGLEFYHDPKKIKKMMGSYSRPKLIETLQCESGPMSC